MNACRQKQARIRRHSPILVESQVLKRQVNEDFGHDQGSQVSKGKRWSRLL